MLGAVLISGWRRGATLAVVACLTFAGCGSSASGASDGRPLVVVTTSILGDVVRTIVGDSADIEVLMGAGEDPHEFAPSARQVTTMREADALVANGLGFESGLSDAIDAARGDGVPVYEVAPDVRPIGDDPHWFTDPSRMADAVPLIAAFLERASALPAGPLDERADGYVADVMAADAQIEATLAPIAPPQRKLVTGHESFTYFADRYDFELVGAVIEGTSTESEPSAQDLDDLARLIVQEDVPAVFGETTHSPRLIEALVRETGVDVRIVMLDSESLGAPGTPADTYIGMMTHDAELIAEALS